MRNSTLWTWCALLVVVFAVSATGCDFKEEKKEEEASAEQPTKTRGAALNPKDEEPDKEKTRVVQTEEYAPEILDLKFKPSKFVKCGKQLEICAKARDRNGDTINFEWTQQAGDEPIEGFSVKETVQTGNNAEQCVTIKPNKGFNQLKLTISQENPPNKGTSTDTISFPLHVGDGNCS